MTAETQPKPRVLVVHDCAELRAQIRELLGGATAVEEAADARQALAIASSRPIDLVLFEAGLLTHDRCRALHNLRADPRMVRTPIVVLAARDADEARHAALAAGADDFISLPLDAVDARARLGVHLRLVAAKRQIEQQLHDQQAGLRAALSASGAGVYRWDIRTGALEWDENLDRLFGFPPGQTIGSLDAFLAMVHPADRQAISDFCHGSLEPAGEFDLTYRVRPAGGGQRWIQDRGKVFQDDEGRPSYVMGACMDVTARKLTELKTLFESELDAALRALDDPAQLASAASQLLCDFLEADHCAYADLEADDNTLDLIGEHRRIAKSAVGRRQLEQFGREAVRLLRSNQPFVADDVDAYVPAPASLLPYRQLEARAVVLAPLHKQGRLVAVMIVMQSAPRPWTAADVELIQHVANRVWESIERTRVARSLMESEFRFRQLADTAPLIVWEARPDGTIDYCNERWYQFTGFQRDAAGDKSWDSILHPDDAPAVRQRWREAVRTVEPLEIEYRFKDRRTGEYRWFMSRAAPVRDAAGKVVRWFGTCTDIHHVKLVEEESRANEERLRAIIEATPECVKVVGRDGAILQMNCSGLAMIEVDSEDDVRHAPVLEFVAPNHRQQWMEYHERVCAGERLRWEYEIVSRSGVRRWMETHAVPVTLPGGERAQLSVSRDITARKRAEVQREQLLQAERAARAEAEQLSRVKDEFLGTLSHELRTPLNAILGFATLMQMSDMAPAEREEAVATIERNARLLAKLVDDLLDMSRILAGRSRLSLQAVSLQEVVRAAVETVRPSASAKGVELQVELDPAAPATRGDAERLQQMAWHLLANAVKFNRRGGWVRVSLAVAGSHLELTVSDSGDGIAPEFLPHVFDRFRQADSSTTRKHGGLGLGLSIVRHLVEQHGGVVRAASPGLGQGATFTVSLPIAEAVEPADAPSGDLDPAECQDSEASADLSGVEVLAVDDDPDSCSMVKRVLEECHARVQTAASAREAFSLLQQRRFHVLISDIGMPSEDGYDLMRAVRALDDTAREVKSVALTAFAGPDDRKRAALAGYQAHLAKPVDAPELVAVIARLAGRQAPRPASAAPK
ncbi:MAG: hypothetical protein DCC67_07920 [Planctomycetota bacterium]|nr:MAG: hypothetical protein DCC67_07920 [Planctomycetota bacterium]